MAYFLTKYGIGDKLYAPRCYKNVEETETATPDGEIITRRYYYEAVVKAKTVSRIEASIDNGGNVTATYQLDEGFFFHPESYLDKMHPNLECARLIAEQHELNKTEFFG